MKKLTRAYLRRLIRESIEDLTDDELNAQLPQGLELDTALTTPEWEQEAQDSLAAQSRVDQIGELEMQIADLQAELHKLQSEMYPGQWEVDLEDDPYTQRKWELEDDLYTKRQKRKEYDIE